MTRPKVTRPKVGNASAAAAAEAVLRSYEDGGISATEARTLMQAIQLRQAVTRDEQALEEFTKRLALIEGMAREAARRTLPPSRAVIEVPRLVEDGVPKVEDGGSTE